MKTTKNTLLALCLIFCMAAALLSGCVKEPTPPAPPTEAPKSQEPVTPSEQPVSPEDKKYGGVASFAILKDPLNLNYEASSGNNIDLQIRMVTSDWLTLYNPNTGEYEPRMLESWEMSEDGKEWTMHVRPGMKWHDGEPVTAEDIVFTYEYLSDPEIDLTSFDQPIEEGIRYELVDELTYKVISDYPNPSQLAPWVCPIPKHIWKDVPPANFSKAKEGYLMVGCGPFKMTEYKVGEYIRFDRFDDYWGGKPYLDTIYYRIIGDSASQIAALESGQIDCVSVAADMAEPLLDKEGIKLWQGPSGNVNRLYFNLTTPQFNDVRVRQAVAHLIQRDIYVPQAMHGFASPAYSDFAPTDFYYVDDPYKKYDFSVEKACQLLDDAGWIPGKDGIREKDGVRMEFEALYAWNAQQALTVYLILTPLFEQAGIKIIPKMPDEVTLDNLFTTHDFIMLDWGTTMGPDPTRYKWIFGTTAEDNIMMYENAETQALFEKAQNELDKDKQREIYEQIQYKLAEDVPNVPLWYRYTIYAYGKNLVIDEAEPIGYEHFRFLHMEKLYINKG